MHEHGATLDIGWLMMVLPQAIAPVALHLGLLLTGMLAGVTHCTAMCGPFVLARAARTGAALPVAASGPWLRLRAGALPAYHLGRALIYGAFGAVAGSFGAGFASIIGLNWVRHAAIGLAVILLLAPVLGAFVRLQPPAGWQAAIACLATRLARLPGLAGDFALGAVLGFLPCGMIYAALAAAAGAGGTLEGASAMVAFAAGTWLPLAVLGALGASVGRRLRDRLRRWALPLAALNLLVLGTWIGHAV